MDTMPSSPGPENGEPVPVDKDTSLLGILHRMKGKSGVMHQSHGKKMGRNEKETGHKMIVVQCSSKFEHESAPKYAEGKENPDSG